MAKKADDLNQILIELNGIKKDTGNIFSRLDRINGAIADYPVSKERLANACDTEAKTRANVSFAKGLANQIGNTKIKRRVQHIK